MLNKTDFVAVPGLIAPSWVDPDEVNHPGHQGVLGAHKGAFGPFPTRAEAERAAVAAGFPVSIVIERRTQ